MNNKVTAREITELSVLCALMFICKEVMDIIPNVHPVTVLIMFATLRYGWKALYPVIGFVVLEVAVFGPGMWTLMYLYIWPILVAVTMAIRRSANRWLWAGIAGAFGLIFGALCTIPYLFTSGPQAAFSFWLAGLSFDLVHGVSNFVLTLVLLPLLMRISEVYYVPQIKR